MYKFAIIFFLSLFYLLNSAAVRRKKRDAVISNAVPKWTYQPSNYSDKLVDVLLRDPSTLDSGSAEYISVNASQKGLIELFLPGASESVFLCFPQNTEDYRQAYILSHVICRQMGFMTFASMNSKLAPSTDVKPLHALKPNSFSCTGQEQNVSHCEWNNVNLGSCKTITELSCGDCQYASKEISGFIEVPGYPLVNIYDVTCEWDLIIEEDHSIALSFLHFQSLFARSSKLFCNLQEPYMDIMYGKRSEMNYKRYCSLNDIKNMTIPHGRVKIKIFTGLHAPYGVKNEAREGKGVAITYEAKPTATTSNSWPWTLTFVALFLLIFLVTSVLCHYCKKYGTCDLRRSNTLPTVNVPPTLADIDRAYEFQRCAVQGPVTEKMGLRLRSNGSGEKVNNKFFSQFPLDETFIVSSTEKKNTIVKENIQPRIYDETPRTTIPEIVLSGVCDDEMDAIERVKVNLLDRYSNNSGDLSSISSKVSISSPVFFPSRQSFQIYSSVSSDTDKEEEKKPPPPPYESAL